MNILPALRDHLQTKIPDQKWDVVGEAHDPRMLMSAVGLSGYITIEQEDSVIRILLRGAGVFDSLGYSFSIDLCHPDFLSKTRMAVRKCIGAEAIDHELRQIP